MAIQKRQSNLYAGEDWKFAYEAFRKINLTAYDYDTIRDSMVQYLRLTYPDTYNDWIANDEFIFILETLSFIGQNIAFRTDLNSRDNFLDTAERRESIIRLARTISYTPKRSYAARGLAKIMEVKTNQDIRNSSGRSLKDVPIRWNDPFERDWFENFILVLNSSFISSNQFGEPIKRRMVDGINDAVYKLNTIKYDSQVQSFQANINGENMSFEVVNPDIDNYGFFVEREPDIQEQQHFIYRNDGNGFDSPNTGFFVLIKQGTLKFSDYVFDDYIENRVQHVGIENVNEQDVWVHEVTEDGIVRNKWVKVPAIESLSYNSVDRRLKNIFAASTDKNDTINVKFPDSKSGTVPRGYYRIWVRSSNGKTYTIKTTDIQNKDVQYKYRMFNQGKYQDSTLNIKISLQQEIRNAQSHETIEQIRERAPLHFYTQNRYISGEDYNIAPMSMGNAVLKAKAINRIYSGQSRFIDINDPTGKYQNVDVFDDSGALYRDDDVHRNKLLKLPTSKTNKTIVVDDIQPLIADVSLIQKYQEDSRNINVEDSNVRWNQQYHSTHKQGTYGTLISADEIRVYDKGTLLEFTTVGGISVWSSVVLVDEEGNTLLSKRIPNGWAVRKVIRPYRTMFSKSEVQQIADILDKRTDFNIYYNSDTSLWRALIGENANQSDVMYVSVKYESDSWVFSATGVNYVFVSGEKVRFFFADANMISNISSGLIQADKIKLLANNINPSSNTGYSTDYEFNILKTVVQDNGYMDGSRAIISTSRFDQNGLPLEPSIFSSLIPTYTGTDAIKYSQSLIFKTHDDFTIDLVEPDKEKIVLLDSKWIYTEDDIIHETNVYKRKALTRNVEMKLQSISGLYNKATGFVVGFKYNGLYYFIEQTIGNNNEQLSRLVSNVTEPADDHVLTIEEAFYRAMENESKQNNDMKPEKLLSYYGYKNVSTVYKVYDNVRTGLNYQWKHYAPNDHRIDPSKTNIIDMYVLTTTYYDEVRMWKKRNDDTPFPKPPTTVELREIFKDIEKNNTISDSMVWHSARFLPIFGKHADDDHKAQFKVIRTENSKLSDDEIRQRVILLIDEFFEVTNWDFGEHFFFTELSAYIHQQLATEIASVIIRPLNINSDYGQLFEIPTESDQLFINTATVDDVVIVRSFAKSNMGV